MKPFLLKRTLFFVGFFCIFTLFMSCTSSFAYSKVKKVRFSTTNSRTRVVFDLSEAACYKDYLSRDRRSLFVELENCQNGSRQNIIKLKKAFIDSIALNRQSSSRLLVRMPFTKPGIEYKIFSLKPFQGKPHRIVVDFSLSNGDKTSSKTYPEKISGNKIIVIDPGHGGQDPGAIGYREIKEKDIVLKIAKELKPLIEQSMPGTKVYLTRKGDYFIPLAERVKIAQRYNADLFVSLHINASRKKYIEGASVYYLSETGATDKAAELLAARENSSDLIAGINLSKDKLLNTILIDLVQTYTINKSIQLCQTLIEGMQGAGFHSEGIKCANFAVLKSPSIPSVLLEIGYITNSRDAIKINSRKYQRIIAQKLAGSLQDYFKTGNGKLLSRSGINGNTSTSPMRANVLN